MALCGGLLIASLPFFPPSKRAEYSQPWSGVSKGPPASVRRVSGVLSGVFQRGAKGLFGAFFRVREAGARKCAGQGRVRHPGGFVWSER